MDKFYISDHSFVHSEIMVNKPQAVRRTIRTRRMRNVEEKEIKKELGGDRGDDQRRSQVLIKP